MTTKNRYEDKPPRLMYCAFMLRVFGVWCWHHPLPSSAWRGKGEGGGGGFLVAYTQGIRHQCATTGAPAASYGNVRLTRKGKEGGKHQGQRCGHSAAQTTHATTEAHRTPTSTTKEHAPPAEVRMTPAETMKVRHGGCSWSGPPPPPRQTPKWLHGTMGFVGAGGAGDFVLGILQGEIFLFDPMCLC